MDKQARLNTIMLSIKEHNEKLEQALHGAELSIKTREWWHLKTCAEKLVLIENLISDLSIEAKALQEDIEEESKEVIL